MSINSSNLLAVLPSSLRDELFFEFNKLLKNYREGRWEPAEMDGGKLCEIVYSILNGHSNNSFPLHASKPSNFYDACKRFENLNATQFSRSIRIQIPRVLIALYEVRNNRGVGHVGGDVSPNRMDATFVTQSAKWLVAELVRIFHNVHIDEATATIDLIIQKESEFIWNIGAKKRVLLKGLDFKMQTLHLLYSCIDGKATDTELFDWTEYSNKTKFKSNILNVMHTQRLIEYENDGNVYISPQGIILVEKTLESK